MIFSPFAVVVFVVLLVGLIVLFALLQIGIMTIAFEKIGLGPGQVFAFLLSSLLGSHVNIPVRRIPGELGRQPAFVNVFGITYRIPAPRFPGTVIAVNVGGALVPMVLSLYLLVRWQLLFEPLLGTALIAFVTHGLARPVPGVGIALPLFVPPLLSALVAVLIASDDHAPAVAYIAGSMGTLIGADLLHISDIKKLHAPVASIGGAGTFDGIFLAGIMAVLLA